MPVYDCDHICKKSSLICSEEGKSPEQTQVDGITQERIIITETVQRRAVFCEMSVGLTAPEERSRDHVCSAIIREEGFQKGTTLIVT